MSTYTGLYELEFERPLIQLEKQIAELQSHAGDQGVDIAPELRNLRQSHTAMLKKIYANLTAWNTVKVARHPARPQPMDYVRSFVQDFMELHGDRAFGDDPAIVTGLGRIGPHKCMIVASNKGKDTKERIACHFGMAHPEGYRKALLKMKMAEKFGVPIVTLVDTPGAYPGIGAEERGQAQAIAVNLLEMSMIRVPIVSVIISEGGSGGALGIAVADRVAMMQYAWYSVISPEGCAAILWKTGEAASQAAESLKLTADQNLLLGTVDDVLEEPLGAAHRDPDTAADRLKKWIVGSLKELKRLKPEALQAKRMERLRNMGQHVEE
ncbi:MAG: acetyl-CoA carboxylase carboxyltransferase subunit alpha [Planctomycetota bacterium]|nr:acetyl-CoA carboxylase carboxyltransferase subunit alpha [Planctomycetota bacterium]